MSPCTGVLGIAANLCCSDCSDPGPYCSTSRAHLTRFCDPLVDLAMPVNLDMRRSGAILRLEKQLRSAGVEVGLLNWGGATLA